MSMRGRAVFRCGAPNQDFSVCIGSMIRGSSTIWRILDAPLPIPVVCQRTRAALGGGQEMSRRTATIRNNSWCGQALLSSSRMRRILRNTTATDPQPGQADVIRAGNGENRVAKHRAAQSLHQRIGQPRQQLPEPVGPESVGGRPISKEIHLLVLDPVLHVPAGAVQSGVEIMVRLWQIGHHEARVGPLGGMLGLHDHPPLPIPDARPVPHRTEQVLFPTRGQVIPLGAFQQRLRPSLQAGVPRDPHDIAYVMGFAPAQHPPSAKATAASQHNLHLRPAGP